MTCRLMKMEHLGSVLDFDTEFHALTAAVLPFFGGSLTLMDLQQEFQSAGQDEALNEEKEEDAEEDAVIVAVEDEPSEPPNVVTSPVKSSIVMSPVKSSSVVVSPVKSKVERSHSKSEEKRGWLGRG